MPSTLDTLGVFFLPMLANQINIRIFAHPLSLGWKNLTVMKKSELTFSEGLLGVQASEARKKGNSVKAFDWAKAAEIIRDRFTQHPDLSAEAGLQLDWDCTGGVIFEDGKPTNENYTYLQSNWAVPTLLLFWDGEEQEEIECFTTEKYDSGSKWDDESLAILGIQLE